MTDPTQKDEGCLAQIAPTFGAILVLALIASVFGQPAAFWFGIGGIIMALLCFWEAGAKKRKRGNSDD